MCKNSKSREATRMTFLGSAKINVLTNLRAPKRDLEERLFYRRRAPPGFYTAKTQSGSVVCIAAVIEVPRSHTVT
jgi:hypothetical protein